ncbi:MAG: hypothetical protein GX607_12920 [Myxococcales bacterium]|jgi:hypothetical protein|nr:hypothetical protein [Myxococcales bacterium]
MKASDIDSHVQCIDHSRPVRVVTIPPDGDGPNGDTVYSWCYPSQERPGQYFSADPNTTPPQLGVESGRRDHATGAETYRERRAFQVSQDQPARGLESTAAPADVHWVKDADVLPSRQTPGGGSQTVVPYNQHGGITPKG